MNGYYLFWIVFFITMGIMVLWIIVYMARDRKKAKERWNWLNDTKGINLLDEATTTGGLR